VLFVHYVEVHFCEVVLGLWQPLYAVLVLHEVVSADHYLDTVCLNYCKSPVQHCSSFLVALMSLEDILIHVSVGVVEMNNLLCVKEDL
jgi:hypothetical protein